MRCTSCYGNSDHMWSDSGIKVLAGSLAAGRLCELEVSVCVVTFT